ncbi:MAG: valine--tRNA ligase [Bacteroidia bacterium]|nr:valine--tRNA ligase [Bacteroidia bacterium]
MEIPKTYDPKITENKWYAYWLKHNFFKSTPDEREPYTIVIPPPNVTGVLHMGHMLNNTIQDVLIRRARMQGKNACWVPGTDHASIATEAKVVALLKEKGIKKTDLSREDFLKHAWEWKEKYGGIILKQLEKLGASCDWDRTKFTMENDLSEAVIDVFIDLYNKQQIYRGVRMVNWDPVGLTAVSDEEVIYKEKDSQLVYISYKIKDSNEVITIATTRPETIMADTAVCVHPEDERYAHLKDKMAIIPLINREVPIIFDEYIDKEFGTGALKVTPAHDINDYNLGLKHKLPVIDGLTSDGKISEAAQIYVGMDRFACRKQIIKDLQEQGFVSKVDTIKNKVGHSERTDAVIEPKLSMQWFLKMDKISKPALDNVLNGEIKLIPEKFVNTYKHWMENVHDWCISRQLWWGQRIPAWYDGQGNTVVAKTLDEAFEKLKSQNSAAKKEDITQDEDVLDTWFSSWLWPLTVFDPKIIQNGWDKANKDLKYYYPTNDLVTAPEILFFWVARMAIAGYEYTGQKPFTNVYLTGIVRDKLGRKMSKSLGNSPDPLDLIEKYGADGVRVGMLLCSPAGNDLPFDESYCEQGRNFSNKVWNAFRLVKGFEVTDTPQPNNNKASTEWFENRFNEQLIEINDLYSKYRMSEALMATYKLVWDDFCAWYLEMIKPEFIDGKAKPIDKITYDATIHFFEQILKLMHPWMPFITEEIWHLIKERDDKNCVIIAQWPQEKPVNKQLVGEFEVCKEIIATIRNIRAQKQISPKEKLELIEKSDAQHSFFDEVVVKLANLSTLKYTKDKVDGAFSFMVKTTEFYVPLASNINVDEERARLTKDLDYSKGFLKSVQAKLANEKFVTNAKPEMVENERKKQADAEAKIKAIEEQLAALK